MWPNSVVKVLCSVSVRTNVPEMKVTPSTMAMPVSTSRSLCASSPLMVTFHMSVPQLLHVLEDRVGGGGGELADDRAVGEEDHSIGMGGTAGVVGDHDDGLVEFRHRPTQESEHLRGRVRVEIPGRFVGEDEV